MAVLRPRDTTEAPLLDSRAVTAACVAHTARQLSAVRSSLCGMARSAAPGAVAAADLFEERYPNASVGPGFRFPSMLLWQAGMARTVYQPVALEPGDASTPVFAALLPVRLCVYALVANGWWATVLRPRDPQGDSAACAQEPQSRDCAACAVDLSSGAVDAVGDAGCPSVAGAAAVAAAAAGRDDRHNGAVPITDEAQVTGAGAGTQVVHELWTRPDRGKVDHWAFHVPVFAGGGPHECADATQRLVLFLYATGVVVEDGGLLQARRLIDELVRAGVAASAALVVLAAEMHRRAAADARTRGTRSIGCADADTVDAPAAVTSASPYPPPAARDQLAWICVVIAALCPVDVSESALRGALPGVPKATSKHRSRDGDVAVAVACNGFQVAMAHAAAVNDCVGAPLQPCRALVDGPLAVGLLLHVLTSGVAGEVEAAADGFPAALRMCVHALEDVGAALPTECAAAARLWLARAQLWERVSGC